MHVRFWPILLQKSAILVVGLPLRPLEADFVGHRHGSYRFCALSSEVLAPGNDCHAESLADPCNCATDIAEFEHAEGASAEIFADAALPSAAAQGRIPINEMTRPGQYECPRQLNCRR